MPSRWIKFEARKPPISTNDRRYWLELYIPERVEAHPSRPPERGYALGLYFGDDNFRLQGQKTFTTERIRAWRRLAGQTEPIQQEIQNYAQKTDIHAKGGAQETNGGGAQEPTGQGL